MYDETNSSRLDILLDQVKEIQILLDLYKKQLVNGENGREDKTEKPFVPSVDLPLS